MNSEFCRIFKELRKDKDMTQLKLGKVFNITQETVSSWERGNSSPSIDELIMIAKYFEVSTDYLLGLED